MWVGGIVQIPLTYLQATPVQALWNFTMVAERRWDVRIWLYTAYFNQCMNPFNKTMSLVFFRQVANSHSLLSAACSTFSDLTYALFPVIFVWKLNMPLRERISLMLVMCGSIFSMTMSILKTIAMGAGPLKSKV